MILPLIPHGTPALTLARRCRRGVLMADLLVAMAIFAVALVPMALMVVREHRLACVLYNRAVAGQILDGELEILLAGEWTALEQGRQPLPVRAAAARSLPPGKFEATLEEGRLRLEWRADRERTGGHTKREAMLPPL